MSPDRVRVEPSTASVPERMLDELFEWLAIPSISSGGGNPEDLRRAAIWARDKIVAAGGSAEVVETSGNPLVLGDLQSTRPGAPTVLIYGHYDVQSADPPGLWTTPPFEPSIRDGRIYARGAADDKGNFFPLLYVACELARSNTLDVNMRVLLEGEEEIAGDSAQRWLAADERGADCAIVFDAEMVDAATPALTLGVRGLVAAAIEVTSASGDLHSGLYGGSVLNAVHVLHAMLEAVLPGPDGRLREELRRGVVEPTKEEREAWALLPPPDALFDSIGARPIDADAARNYYMRNWADASLDVNGIAGGDAVQRRTIIPAKASAKLTLRLAPAQRGAEMAEVLVDLLRSAAPAGADVTIESDYADPASFDPKDPALQIAIRALEESCGKPPALVRSGGSIPVLSAFAERGIPVILSGFALAEDGFHAPNESFRLESLRLGTAAARSLFSGLAKLPPRA